MSEREYFNKLIKLLSGGGVLVLRRLLEKYSEPLSFADYIYHNQATVLGLKLFKEQQQLVITREIDKMDITLLGKLVMGLFKNKMTAIEKTSVNNIKEERNNFMHSDVLKEAKIEEHVFYRRWKIISSILLDAAVEIGPNEFKTHVETFIKETEENLPKGNEIHEILITWCESNELLAEQVHESNVKLGEQVNESNVKLGEQVRESNVKLGEQVVKLGERVHESNMKLTEQVIESHKRLAEQDHDLKTKIQKIQEKFQCNYEYNTKLDTEITDSIAGAIGHLQKEYSVLLYGNPGEGKTFSAFRMVKYLVENNIVTLERCALLSNPKDLSLIKRDDTDLILIDDMFGTHNADSNRFSEWETYFPTLQSIVRSHQIRLIMCSRMHIFEQYRKKLDGVDIFSRTIELGSAKLSPGEKRKMLIQQLELHKRKVDEVNVDECISQAVVGFPLCAQQFASDDLLFSKKTGYFRKPYRYFREQNIKTLDDQSFIALLLVFYKGNKLQVNDLDLTKMGKDTQSLLVHIASLRGVEKPTSLIVRETKEKIVSMEGSYTRIVDNEVSFFHDTMYETIAQIHYQEYPAEVIKYCTLDYLSRCIYLEGQKNGEGITVKEADLQPFLERCSYELTEAIKNRKKDVLFSSLTSEKVLGHRLFKHPNCRRELLDHMKRDPEKYEDLLKLFIYHYHSPIHFVKISICSMWLNGDTFWKEIMPTIECSHLHKMDDGCLKCNAKAVLLSGACYENSKDVHTFLRRNKVPLGIISSILYNAVKLKNIGTEFIKYLTSELVNKDDLSINDKHLMQLALWKALDHNNSYVTNALKASGLLPSSVFCYCAVRIGSHQEIHASLLFLPLLQYDRRLYHVLKRISLNKGDANIICELITATQDAQEPFQNLDLIVHGIKFIRDWANTVVSREMDWDNEKDLLNRKYNQAWKTALSSFMELKLDENMESEVLNEETSLTTSLLLKEVSARPRCALSFTAACTYLWYTITDVRDDKSWSPEDAVICSLALIDEDLSVQRRKIWRYMEPSNSIETISYQHMGYPTEFDPTEYGPIRLFGDNTHLLGELLKWNGGACFNDDPNNDIKVFSVHPELRDVLSAISEHKDVSEQSLRDAINVSVSIKNRKIANKLLNFASRLLKGKISGQMQDVWPAYEQTKEWIPIFIVLSRDRYPEDTYLGYRIFWRKWDNVITEGSIVANSKQVRDMSYDEMEDMQKLISRENLLERYRNITVVSASPNKSRNGGKDIILQNCIVIYTLLKGFIPFDEEPFPEMISGVPVDVREAYVTFGMKRKKRKLDEMQMCEKTENKDNQNSSGNQLESDLLHSVQQLSLKDTIQNDNDTIMANSSKYESQGATFLDHPENQQKQDLLERKETSSMKAVCENFTQYRDTKQKQVQAKPKLGKKSCDRNDPLLAGSQVQLIGNDFCGTLGYFVILPDNGGVGALTCAHVVGVYNGVCGEDRKKVVVQPSVEMTSDDSLEKYGIGNLFRAVFDEKGSSSVVSVDAALIKVQRRVPEKAEFIETDLNSLLSAGFDLDHLPSFKMGKIMKYDQLRRIKRRQVIKYGSQSALTLGMIRMYGTNVKIVGRSLRLPNEQNFSFFKQIEIQSVTGCEKCKKLDTGSIECPECKQFFYPGDSGSLVFMPRDNNETELDCIGLAIAYTSYGSCIVTPIEKVFEKLELDSARFL